MSHTRVLRRVGLGLGSSVTLRRETGSSVITIGVAAFEDLTPKGARILARYLLEAAEQVEDPEMSDEVSLLVDTTEAAERLSVSVRWLQKGVTAGMVPHVRVGRRVYFSEDNIAEIRAVLEETATGKPAL